MVADFARRGLPWVQGGELISAPIPETTERERRSEPWPGFHTEFYDIDVRH